MGEIIEKRKVDMKNQYGAVQNLGVFEMDFKIVINVLFIIWRGDD
jgi:hypothetical protein